MNKVQDFFLSVKNPNFLTMKLLNDVFRRMSASDDVSRHIIENFDVFSGYNFVLDGDMGIDNYVNVRDDLSLITIFLSTCCSEVDASHEFGHVLLELFGNGSRPKDFDSIMDKVQQSMLKRKKEIRGMLQGFSDEVYDDYLEHEDEFYQFLQLNPELRKEYFKRNPDALDQDFEEDIKLHFFANYTTFDEKAMNYNKIANIIDSIFYNDGNFYESYGNDEFFPVLSMHDDAYFEEADVPREQVSFEEQFAEYLSLKLYEDRLGFAISVLHDILGDEWFEMMDEHYETISRNVSEKGKVFTKK